MKKFTVTIEVKIFANSKKEAANVAKEISENIPNAELIGMEYHANGSAIGVSV